MLSSSSSSIRHVSCGTERGKRWRTTFIVQMFVSGEKLLINQLERGNPEENCEKFRNQPKLVTDSRISGGDFYVINLEGNNF